MLDSTQHVLALGSGVVFVFDTTVSAVDVLEWLLRFFRFESCGKCTPCREGTYIAHRIAERIARSKGQPGDLQELHRLATMLANTSLCGLGQSVALPIQTAIIHFADDFKRCGAT